MADCERVRARAAGDCKAAVEPVRRAAEAEGVSADATSNCAMAAGDSGADARRLCAVGEVEVTTYALAATAIGSSLARMFHPLYRRRRCSEVLTVSPTNPLMSLVSGKKEYTKGLVSFARTNATANATRSQLRWALALASIRVSCCSACTDCFFFSCNSRSLRCEAVKRAEMQPPILYSVSSPATASTHTMEITHSRDSPLSGAHDAELG